MAGRFTVKPVEYRDVQMTVRVRNAWALHLLGYCLWVLFWISKRLLGAVRTEFRQDSGPWHQAQERLHLEISSALEWRR